MSANTQYRDESWLREKYHDEGLSQREIAAICDRSRRTIRDWMDTFGIEARDAGITNEQHGFDVAGSDGPPFECDGCGKTFLIEAALLGHRGSCT